MGCKYEDAVNYMKTGQRINRYIVGCKYVLLGWCMQGIGRINRYIVGCKYRWQGSTGDSVWELIDT